MHPDVFTDHYKSEPYWWEATPRPLIAPAELPPAIDVAVIGSGYSGLHAALVTARAGRSTLVLERGEVGSGCSTRNGGQISTSIKPGLAALTRRYGEARAREIMRDGVCSLAWIQSFVEEEGIDCDLRTVGRFHAAHSAGAFDELVASTRAEDPEFRTGAVVVPREAQRRELGTDRYHGGVVFPNHASVDPGLYHQGLLDRALAAGTQVAEQAAVEGIARGASGFVLRTPRGEIRAREVVVATNGYTGPLTPWLQRRIIPIGSYVIATEPVPEDVMARLMPTDRIVSDTRKVVYYYRPSPDRRRIIFGGRVSLRESDPRVSGPLLLRELVRLFPELSGVRISHSWMGFVGYTFDTLAHMGQQDGLHYAMGYCGSGVGMASYLGMRLGRQVVGGPEGNGLAAIRFPTRPLYTGNPWFLAPSVAYYRWKDERRA